MPTVTLNRPVFEKLVGKKLPTDKLKERISMMGTDLEDVTDTEIHVEVFPNRPDWLSEQGFARSFAAFIGEKPGLREYYIKKSGLKVAVDKNVTMRPYTACAIVKNLTFNDERIREIMQVQEKLATTHGRNRKKSAYGIYPLNTIQFPIRYTAKDPKEVLFQPLGFSKKIPASQVEELHPKGKEYRHVAEGWKKYPFFIDSKNNVMCMLPYTNSDDTGKIDEETTEVFIECTGTDMANVKVALSILTTTLADMGGEIYSIDIEYPDRTITTPDLAPTKMEFDLGYINKRLGLSLSEKEASTLLARMNYGYENGYALIPAYRADILHQVDLLEDIAIAYGYENFEEILPKVATIAMEAPFEVFRRKMALLLTGLGFLETASYHLIEEETQTRKMLVQAGDPTGPHHPVKVLDPVSLEYNSLRSWMLPCLLHILQRNRHQEYPQNLFETGRVFKKEAVSETKTEEKECLAVVLCHQTADITSVRQVYDYLLRMLKLQEKSMIEETAHPSFIPGRAGKGMISATPLAVWGEVHPAVLEKFGISQPVAALELDLTALWNLLEK
ncbi:phenylalanine--tRNA ligase subunit beta [Candidatus Woesearchaeota archaeon]|nr:phenylalanine--tRNA ligase subunit beta [Candidatus Woesearchaeota archaeon]